MHITIHVALQYLDSYGGDTPRQWRSLGEAAHETLNSTWRTMLIPEPPVLHWC